MAKIALVFSGQGAQYSGMGKSLYDTVDEVKELYTMADAVRPGTSAQSFDGTAEELSVTKNTQPCLYLVDLAAALALKANGINADGVAGFSLGEIAALAYAGAYSYEEGFKIVTKRGELMNDATTSVPTAMAAILKLDADTIVELTKGFDNLYAVNFNCPGQTVVSGSVESVEAFKEKVAEAGGSSIQLNVAGAFHSPFMAEASKGFGIALNSFELNLPQIPVYANYTAKPYTEIHDTLTAQMCNPVRWQETIENMIADGFDTFIEVGAGKTLSKLIKKISKEVSIYSVEDEATLAKTLEALKA